LGPFQLLATGGVGLKPLTREKWQSGPNMLNKKNIKLQQKNSIPVKQNVLHVYISEKQSIVDMQPLL